VAHALLRAAFRGALWVRVNAFPVITHSWRRQAFHSRYSQECEHGTLRTCATWVLRQLGEYCSAAGTADPYGRITDWTGAAALDMGGSILGLMPTRVVRFLASALAAFLLAQLIPALAFASSDASDASCCCKDKSASCCRRMHGMPHRRSFGPAFSSRECCGQCQISVRQSQPVADSVTPAILCTELAPAISSPLAWLGWIPSAHHDAVLFERPPPSAL
jgi:hypothetical protein